MVEVPLLAQRATSSKKSAVGDPGVAVLDLWLFFNIGPSHFLLPLLCISLLLQRARRNLLLVNVAITWCICGFASSVLLYAGKQTGPEPSALLCSTQASLLYAIPPLTSSAVFALVLSVWINLCWKRGERLRGFYLAVMLITPYMVYFTFAAIGAMLASREPRRVSRTRRFFYCSIDHSLFSGILALYAAIVLVMTVVLQCWIGVTIWRNHRLLKEATRIPPSKSYPMEPMKERKGLKPDDVQFAVRLGIFGVYIVIGLTLSLLSIVAPTSAVPDVVFASMGLAVCLVFGTQPKLWLVWRDLFRQAVKEEESHVPTLTPFQLDPLPGQQSDPEAPPVPEKPWLNPSAPTQVYNSPAYMPTAGMSQPVMSEKRVLASRFQDPGSRRPPSTATIADHPYRVASHLAIEVEPQPRVITLTSPVNQQRVVQLRGKQPLNSPFPASTSVPTNNSPQRYSSGRVLSSYESQSNLLAAAAAMSYQDQSRLGVPGESYESQGPLVAAASYQSQYLTPNRAFNDRDADGLPSPTGAGGSIGYTSGNATYNSSSGDEDGRSFGSSSGASLVQRLEERARRTDPVMPRY